MKFSASLALAALAALVPLAAQAQQKVLLERSSSYALDNKFKAYQVPVLDSSGRVKYFDVTVTLNVTAAGTLGTSASVVATPAPPVTNLVITPGSYRASDGTICTVTNVTTATGRVQSSFSCALNMTHIDFAVATGAIVAGHPFYTPLHTIGVDGLGDAASRTWGMVLNSSSPSATIAGCNNITTNPPNAIGAVASGNSVSISKYTSGGASIRFTCGFILTKQ